MIATVTYPLAVRAAGAARAVATAATSMGFSPNQAAAAADVAAFAVLDRPIADVRKSLRRMLRTRGGDS